MAKKIKEFEKMVSVSEVDKMIGENYEPVCSVVCGGIEVLVKKHLSLHDMLDFVDAVVSGCFDEGGKYMPEVRDFYVRKCIIEKYTNVSLPSNTEKMYGTLYHSHIVDEVIAAIDGPQFNELMWAIDKKLAYTANTNIQRLYKSVEDAVESFMELEKKATELYANVSNGDMQKLVAALGKISEFDTDKLIDAVAALRSGAK